MKTWVVERERHGRHGWVRKYYQAKRGEALMGGYDGAWYADVRYATKLDEATARREAGNRQARAVPLVVVLQRSSAATSVSSSARAANRTL